MTKRWQFLLLCLCLLGIAAAATSAQPAPEGVLIKMGTMAPDGSTWHDGLLRIRQEWRRISNGEVLLRIYAGGILGDEAEMIRQLRRRGLDADGVGADLHLQGGPVEEIGQLLQID